MLTSGVADPLVHEELVAPEEAAVTADLEGALEAEESPVVFDVPSEEHSSEQPEMEISDELPAADLEEPEIVEDLGGGSDEEEIPIWVNPTPDPDFQYDVTQPAVAFDFGHAGVAMKEAGVFGGKYPERVRKTVTFSADSAFHGSFSVEGEIVFVEPSTYFEAIHSPEADKWVAAMEEEMDSLKSLGTWTLVSVSPSQAKKALPVKWVFKVKLTESGSVERFKARLVAKGFKQIYGIDYTEVFAPVSKYSTLRYLLSVAVHKNMHTHQMDVSTAFLHGNLEEEVYVKQPEGFHVGGPEVVCKLHKALYGLKQAPRAWYETISGVLKSAGFVISSADPSLFILRESGKEPVYLLLYVDDILIQSVDLAGVSAVKSMLSTHFKVKDLGEARYFLGMQILQVRDEFGVLRSIKLSNEKLTSTLVASFGMSDAKPRVVPLDPSVKLAAAEGDYLPLENRYQELVGGILYLANTVRPDISFAAGLLGRFSSKPTTTHMSAGLNVLKYLKGTLGMGLVWEKGKAGVVGFVDSDYAGDLDGRKSTSGHVFLSGKAAFTWASKLQRLAALSTVEAEFISLCLGVQEALWLAKLVHDVEGLYGAVTIYSDNTGALVNIRGSPISPRTKHIGVRYHRIRDEVGRGAILPLYVPSEENIADLFTKPLI